MREMRRFKQALTPQECAAVLERNTAGVLALTGDGGCPYAVPLSYVWLDGRVYFHFALAGHKLDAVRADGRASFCVVDQDQIVPEEYTTYYRSVILFGTAQVVDDPEEKRRSIDALCAKYRPGFEAERAAEKPGKRLEKKPSIRQALQKNQAEVAARSAPVPDRDHKPPEAAL